MEKDMNEDGSGAKQSQKLFGVNADEFAMLVRMFLENKDQVKTLVELFSPVVGESIDLAMDAVGPQVSKIAMRISLGKADNRKAVLDKYMELGFYRDEALAFMLADIGATDKAASTLAKGVTTTNK